MKAYICVYRHPLIGNKIQKIAKSITTPSENIFLEEYPKENCYYDWGDDPSFFAATIFHKDIRCASWGVCRTNVRKNLKKDDLVIYFCGRESEKSCAYYFIGFGTVAESISRKDIFQLAEYELYRSYLNLLVKSDLTWSEPLGNVHDDWEKRISAGYILFNPDPELTDFNVSNPLHVAIYKKNGSSPFECWFSNSNIFVSSLENILFRKNKIQRRLRSTNIQHAHPHIALHNKIVNCQDWQLIEIREELCNISNQVRNVNAGTGNKL